MRTKVSNHKGDEDWIECGPRSPLPIGPHGEKHSKGGAQEDDAAFGIYFSTPGHRPMMQVTHDDIEGTYAVV